MIGSPEIADVLPMTDTTFYVQGKRVGTTNISVFDWERHLLAVIDLEVIPDTGTLHSNIVASTGGENINVTSANGQVVLSGEASDAVGAARSRGGQGPLAKRARHQRDENLPVAASDAESPYP